MNAPVLAVHHLSFAYPGKSSLFEDVDFQAKAGEAIAIVGRSGCGKSTLAHCCAGIIPRLIGGTLQGEVELFGESVAVLPLSRISTRLGVVFQNPDTQLFFSTVEDEVAFAPENLGCSPQEVRERIGQALQMVGIEHLRHSHPHELSGGQKQLVALAAVLSLQPDILIFDEAVSQVDKAGKMLVFAAMNALKEAGKTLLMIEHDLDNLALADEIKVLRGGRLETFVGRL